MWEVKVSAPLGLPGRPLPLLPPAPGAPAVPLPEAVLCTHLCLCLHVAPAAVSVSLLFCS